MHPTYEAIGGVLPHPATWHETDAGLAVSGVERGEQYPRLRETRKFVGHCTTPDGDVPIFEISFVNHLQGEVPGITDPEALTSALGQSAIHNNKIVVANRLLVRGAIDTIEQTRAVVGWPARMVRPGPARRISHASAIGIPQDMLKGRPLRDTSSFYHPLAEVRPNVADGQYTITNYLPEALALATRQGEVIDLAGRPDFTDPIHHYTMVAAAAFGDVRVPILESRPMAVHNLPSELAENELFVVHVEALLVALRTFSTIEGRKRKDLSTLPIPEANALESRAHVAGQELREFELLMSRALFACPRSDDRDEDGQVDYRKGVALGYFDDATIEWLIKTVGV